MIVAERPGCHPPSFYAAQPGCRVAPREAPDQARGQGVPQVECAARPNLITTCLPGGAAEGRAQGAANPAKRGVRAGRRSDRLRRSRCTKTPVAASPLVKPRIRPADKVYRGRLESAARPNLTTPYLMGGAAEGRVQGAASPAERGVRAVRRSDRGMKRNARSNPGCRVAPREAPDQARGQGVPQVESAARPNLTTPYLMGGAAEGRVQGAASPAERGVTRA